MFKRIRSEPIACLVLTVLLAFAVAGAAWRVSTRFPNGLWVGPLTNTALVASGAGDIYASGYIEAATGVSFPTGSVTGTMIADVTRSFEIPLAGMFINGTGPMGNDGTTAPGMATTNGIPKIVYAGSAETTSIGYSFMTPTDYVGALAFRMLVSSTAATPASMSIDWQIWVNKNGVVFDAVPFEQVAVSPTINNTATNEFLTFTADATALAGIAAGDSITVWFWNADLRTSGTTEIGAIQARYTATQ